MPELSILIPHKRDPENNKALSIATACIGHNTSCDYELLIDATTPADPYVCLNALAQAARGKYLFFSNSDIFVAPHWDTELLKYAAQDRLVTCTLVECGSIGVHGQNIQANFGMRPDTFNYEEFEAFCAHKPIPPAGPGFYYYHLIDREVFLADGMFNLANGLWPTPLDSQLWEAWLKKGRSIVRAPFSYMYHLQNYSTEKEQTKAVRHQ